MAAPKKKPVTTPDSDAEPPAKALDIRSCWMVITGTAIISFAKYLGDEEELRRKSSESWDAYEARVWKERMVVQSVDGVERVMISEFALRSALYTAAQKSGEKIEGQGNTRWAGAFKSGLAIDHLNNYVPTSIRPDDIIPVDIVAHANGQRDGSGARVMRRFPCAAPPWSITCRLYLLDQRITRPTLERMGALAGLTVGLGRYRPEQMGNNGRFITTFDDWRNEKYLPGARAA